MVTETQTTRTRIRHPWMIAVSLYAIVVACANLVPSQGWDRAHGPVVPHDTFPTDCTLCHLPGSWNEIREDFEYDHEKETGVALLGAHAEASCLRCHNDRGPVAQFAARGCAGCHEDVHRGDLGPDCTQCHDERNWRPDEMIARHDRTRLPLVGAHVAAACYRCHPGAQVGNFEGADPTCLTCHADDLARAVSPDHAANGWTTDCQRCHAAFDWRPARFVHPSSFPLVAGHGGLSCERCHSPSTTGFTGLSTDCASCHLADFQATTDPSHAAAGFDMNCTTCHDATVWNRTDYRHPATFELTGGHAGPRCSACHGGNVFSGTPNQCVDCHLADYQGVRDPNHVTGGFSTNCTQCHSTVRWGGANFAHTAAFPLTGAHATTACDRCHVNQVYAGTPNQCVDCHLADYQGTSDPNHTTAGFPTDCAQCHGTTRWSGATFVHAFPITTGRHAFDCAECHRTPSNFTIFSCTHCHDHRQSEMDSEHRDVSGYTWTSTACLSCHPNGRE